jgi:hypothetical protein
VLKVKENVFVLEEDSVALMELVLKSNLLVQL